MGFLLLCGKMCGLLNIRNQVINLVVEYCKCDTEIALNTFSERDLP